MYVEYLVEQLPLVNFVITFAASKNVTNTDVLRFKNIQSFLLVHTRDMSVRCALL